MRCTLLVLILCFSISSLQAAEPAPPPARQEELDPDVLRKIRKLIQGTLSEETAEREKAWTALRNMGNLSVPGLVGVYRLKETTPEMMRSIMIALGDSKDPRAGPALVEMLQAKSALVRRDVARALGDSGYKEAIPALEKLAAASAEEEMVRLFAAVAGAKMGSEPAVDALKILLKSEDAQVRSRAVFALGKHGGLKQVQAIESALDDNERDVREDAVEALRLLQKKPAWGALVKATKDSDYKVRNNAMDALKELSGEKIEAKPELWQEWWAKEKEKPEPAEKEKVKE